MACKLYVREVINLARYRIARQRHSLHTQTHVRDISTGRHVHIAFPSGFRLPFCDSSASETPSQQIRPWQLRRHSHASIQYPTCRAFSTSPKRVATIITTNPRKDDDGKVMEVDITQRAANVRDDV